MLTDHTLKCFLTLFYSSDCEIYLVFQFEIVLNFAVKFNRISKLINKSYGTAESNHYRRCRP